MPAAALSPPLRIRVFVFSRSPDKKIVVQKYEEFSDSPLSCTTYFSLKIPYCTEPKICAPRMFTNDVISVPVSGDLYFIFL